MQEVTLKKNTKNLPSTSDWGSSKVALKHAASANMFISVPGDSLLHFFLFSQNSEGMITWPTEK